MLGSSIYAQDDWIINDDFKLTLGTADKPLYFNTTDLIQNLLTQTMGSVTTM
jgi:hypothetical protein